MLGRDHALTGACAFMALSPILHGTLHALPSTPIPIGVGAVVSGAFALLPDIDEPGSTVSRKLGPLSRGVSKVTNKLAGGHRQATHSLLFAAAVYLLVRLAGGHPLAEAIVVGCAFLLVFRMLVPKVLRYAGLVAPVMAALTGLSSWWVFQHPDQPWLAIAAGGGVVWHMVGDTVTVEGVPWLWVPFVRPLQKLRISVPLVGHCGSTRETVVGSLLALGVLYCTAASVVVPLVTTHFPSVQVPRLPVV
ncbi:MAG: metal-dependent hydrolase [Acidimicrobiales bacterium]